LTTLDLIQYVDRLPGPDEKVQSKAARLEFGGPAANAAFTSVAVGTACHLLTAVGPSPLGTLAAQQIRASGIDLIDAVADEWTLPVSAVAVSDQGRCVISRNGAEPPELRGLSALEHYDALLVDGHHVELALTAAREAHTRGVPVLLDGGSWKPGLERLLPLVDAAVVSADFKGALPDIPVAVTRGQHPIQYRWQHGKGTVDVAPVTGADTLGAGDVFHGAWLSYVSRHGLTDFPAGLEYAAEVASFSCRYPGAHEWARHYRQPQPQN
jgi:sugar/nucleoside kinase (ribokinase family)